MAVRFQQLTGLFLIAAASITARGAGESDAEQMSALLRDLHSTQYSTREAATLGLMRLGAAHCSEVEASLVRETDPETVIRLKRAAVHLYMKARTPLAGDIGVLGISLQTEAIQLDRKNGTVQMAVVVMKTQPGFPAAESLENGDRIVGINGERFTFQSSPADFQGRINRTPPGTTVRLAVLRDGKFLDVPVRVAGLRAEDGPLFRAIVDQRDIVAAQYVAGLKSGLVSPPLVMADGSQAPRAYGLGQNEAPSDTPAGR